MRFDDLQRIVTGEWRGSKRLYMEPPPERPLESQSTLVATPIAGGNFLQFSYSWSYEGEEQTGVLVFGYDEENAASCAWVDSFHMSSKIMYCTGHAAEGRVQLQGSYAAPPGPDWGWRIA